MLRPPNHIVKRCAECGCPGCKAWLKNAAAIALSFGQIGAKAAVPNAELKAEKEKELSPMSWRDGPEAATTKACVKGISMLQSLCWDKLSVLLLEKSLKCRIADYQIKRWLAAWAKAASGAPPPLTASVWTASLDGIPGEGHELGHVGSSPPPPPPPPPPDPTQLHLAEQLWPKAPPPLKAPPPIKAPPPPPPPTQLHLAEQLWPSEYPPPKAPPPPPAR